MNATFNPHHKEAELRTAAGWDTSRVEDARYSIPFSLNANPDYRMTCIPSCCGPGNPAKYAPISYNESQAVVQGE